MKKPWVINSDAESRAFERREFERLSQTECVIEGDYDPVDGAADQLRPFTTLADFCREVEGLALWSGVSEVDVALAKKPGYLNSKRNPDAGWRELFRREFELGRDLKLLSTTTLAHAAHAKRRHDCGNMEGALESVTLAAILYGRCIALSYVEQRRHGGNARVANDPKQSAKAEALKLWRERRAGRHPELRTNEQFATECMRRWPALKSAKVILGWCTDWNKAAKARKPQPAS